MASDLSRQILDAMQEYSGIVAETVENVLKGVGKEAAQRVKSESPKRTGAYKRGWKVNIDRRNGSISVTVHNKKYQLTHLLENGHKTRSGTMTKAQPHIKPVEEWAERTAIARIGKEVKG